MGNDCHLRESRHDGPQKRRERQNRVVVTARSYCYRSRGVLVKLGCQTVSSCQSNEPVSRFEKFNSESPSSTSPFQSIENLIFGYVAGVAETFNSNRDTLLFAAASRYNLCCLPFFVQCLLSVFSIRAINTVRRNQQFAKIANNVIEEKYRLG